MQYAIPAIIAMAASSLYNIIDGIFIGQGVGPEAIMGLALTQPFMSLTAAFGAMVGVGASTLMSVRLGQKDYDTAQHILGNVIVMNVVMGLGLGLILLVLLDPILLFFGASQQTLPYAHDFMSIILIGNVVTHLYLGLNALLRSTRLGKYLPEGCGEGVESAVRAAQKSYFRKVLHGPLNLAAVYAFLTLKNIEGDMLRRAFTALSYGLDPADYMD